MNMIDLDVYSLILVKEDNVIYRSEQGGLRPLIECLIEIDGKYNGCVLYDRVIGLAAAIAVVKSGVISEIHTPVCSSSAYNYLTQQGIAIFADKLVANILTRDRLDICMMEKEALKATDYEVFYNRLRTKFLEKD